jgi:ABC-type multidrug transport system ATPase subunit
VVTEYIEHLRGEGKAVILTTHHLDDAQRLCTHFGLLHRGRLVSEGTLAELQRKTGCTNLIDIFLRLSEVGSVLFRRPLDESGHLGLAEPSGNEQHVKEERFKSNEPRSDERFEQ